MHGFRFLCLAYISITRQMLKHVGASLSYKCMYACVKLLANHPYRRLTTGSYTIKDLTM